MPVIQFDRERHEYRADGRLVPSVTRVLEQAGLVPDYARIPPAVLTHARDRGIYVDGCCDLFDADALDWPSVHPEAEPYVRAWQRFREREAFTPVVSQAVVYHAELDYAGTADVYGLDRAKAPTIVDRKCTSKLSDTYSLQLAAYSLPGIGYAADESDGELIGLTVARRLVVQLRNDGTFALYDCDVEMKRAGRDDFGAWKAAVAIARWKATTNGHGTR